MRRGRARPYAPSGFRRGADGCVRPGPLPGVGNLGRRPVRRTAVPSRPVSRVRAGLLLLAVAAPAVLAGCAAPADRGGDNPAGVLISTPGSTSVFHGTELAEPYHKP